VSLTWLTKKADLSILPVVRFGVKSGRSPQVKSKQLLKTE